jgi:serine/threonine-protein kinase
MAEVWLGRSQTNGSLAAIKILKAAKAEELQLLFAREQRAVLRLRHPNIVPVFDVGEDYIATAFVEGVDLRHRIRSPITAREAVDITCDIASALQAAHDAGVVHCDVKPANILIDRSGTPFLADFGIAQLVDDPEADSDKVLGTPAFMAPEQAMGEPSVKADQYSLAKTLLALLGGDPTMHPAQQILALPDELAALGKVLATALSTDPGERYDDMAAFAAALRATPLPETDAPSRRVRLVRDPAAFAWAKGHRGRREFGEHIVRLDYRLSDLVERGLIERGAAAAFLESTGHEDFGWSLYARDERLGPPGEPESLARARQNVVLLHGLFANREVWPEVAVGIARDNGLGIVLTPDLMGFGESPLAGTLPEDALTPAGLVRSLGAWLELLGVDRAPSVVLGHSYSATALLCAGTEKLGSRARRICIVPVMFFHRFRARLQVRVNALFAFLMPLLPNGLRWWFTRRAFRRDPSLNRTRLSARDDMARAALRLGGWRVARLFWRLAKAHPADPKELEVCTVVSTPDDPLVESSVAEEAIATTGIPDTRWFRLVYGGHFPQLVDDDHPEWGARNVHELVSLVDSVLDMTRTTEPREDEAGASVDTGAETQTVPV